MASFYTHCIIVNSSMPGQYLTNVGQKNWDGSGEAPKKIPPGSVEIFDHMADDVGSIAGVAYLLENTLKWVFAWSNKGDGDNQVYTKIIGPSEPVEWDKVKKNLAAPPSTYTYAGFKSTVTIDTVQSVKTATMNAKLEKLGGTGA